MLFIFDTSSFRVLQNYYPDQFPSFWTSFNELVESQEVISVRDVYRELERQITKRWFQEWLERNRALFLIPTAEETEYVGRIFAVPHFLNLIGQKQILTGMPVADPFVIASAGVREACVVTEEDLRPNAAKIPNVCEHFGVECKNLETTLASLGWRF